MVTTSGNDDLFVTKREGQLTSRVHEYYKNEKIPEIKKQTMRSVFKKLKVQAKLDMEEAIMGCHGSYKTGVINQCGKTMNHYDNLLQKLNLPETPKGE